MIINLDETRYLKLDDKLVSMYEKLTKEKLTQEFCQHALLPLQIPKDTAEDFLYEKLVKNRPIESDYRKLYDTYGRESAEQAVRKAIHDYAAI